MEHPVTMDTASKLRIGFVVQNPGFDFDRTDAPVLQVRHIVTGLQNTGHSVQLMTLRSGRRVSVYDEHWHERTARVKWSKGAIFRIPESSIRRVQSTLKLPYFALFDSLRFADACVQELAQVQLIHERNALLSLGPVIASRLLRKPYILSVDAEPLLEMDFMEIPLASMQRSYLSWAARYAYQHTDAITCVSEPSKQHLVQNWGVPETKLYVLPNGVDTDIFAPHSNNAPSILEHLGNVPVVMFVGGFWPWQDLSLLVHSFAQVLQDVPQARLVLVGDGLERDSVARQVSEYNLENSVIFTGAVAHRDVPTYLRAADVTVVVSPANAPNSHLGSPMKLYEYMASGKAIVATGVGQTTEVIRHGHNGLLVPPGDADALTQAIVRLLLNPAEREQLGNHARQQAVDQHSWQQYVKRLEEIYYDVLQRNTRRGTKPQH